MDRPATAAVRLLTGEREPVRLATTAAIDVDAGGLLLIDGVQTAVGDRVLVKDQVDGSENGIRTVSAGQWYRAADARTARTMQKGTTVHVQNGTVNGGKTYVFTADNPVIGDTAITIAFYTSDDLLGDVNTAIDNAAAAAAGLSAIGYAFSTTTTDADPGTGQFRLNNGTITSATAAYLDNLDDAGTTVSGIIDTWDDSTNIVRGILTVRAKADPAARHVFAVVGAVVDGTGYRKLSLTYVGGSGSFPNGSGCWISFTRAGDAGDGFLMWAASDEVTPISASTGKLQKRFPYAFTMTGIRAALVTAQTSGSLFTVDVKWWNGASWASILSTLITFDNGERSSVTAATAPVLSKTSFVDDDEFRIDVTQIGDGTAKGLSVTFLGRHS